MHIVVSYVTFNSILHCKTYSVLSIISADTHDIIDLG